MDINGFYAFENLDQSRIKELLINKTNKYFINIDHILKIYEGLINCEDTYIAKKKDITLIVKDYINDEADDGIKLVKSLYVSYYFFKSLRSYLKTYKYYYFK